MLGPGAAPARSANPGVRPPERRHTGTWKRPDRAQAIAARRNFESFTVKTGFAAICRSPDLAAAV